MLYIYNKLTITNFKKKEKMIKKTKPNRYQLFQNEVLIKEAPTKILLADEIGCTIVWVYKGADEEGNFKYQNNNYKIVDKLELI